MEVCHPPRLGYDSHLKKYFKEYFLEFLMVFLAVAMDFILENTGENLRSHSEEEEYIINIKKDLSADTASLNDFLPYLISMVDQAGTSIKLFHKNGASDRGGDLYEN